MNTWEVMLIQKYHGIGRLINEQQKPDHNPLYHRSSTNSVRPSLLQIPVRQVNSSRSHLKEVITHKTKWVSRAHQLFIILRKLILRLLTDAKSMLAEHTANILKYVTSIKSSNFTMYFMIIPDDGLYWPKHVGVNNFIILYEFYNILTFV